jgi:hypothetical protein
MHGVKPAAAGGKDGLVQKFGCYGEMRIRLKIMIAIRSDVVEREDHASPCSGRDQLAGAR